MTQRSLSVSTAATALSPKTGGSISVSPSNTTATFTKGSLPHRRSTLNLPLTMVFELDLAKTDDCRTHPNTEKGALEAAKPNEDTKITIDLQYGFQVCVRGLSREAATCGDNSVGMAEQPAAVELTFLWNDQHSRHGEMSKLIPAIKTIRILGEDNVDGSLGVHLSTAIRNSESWTQHGVSVFLDESEATPTASATATMSTFRKTRQRFLVILSRYPIRFFFPVFVLDPVRSRLHKKPFGQSLLSKFLVRAAKESVTAASVPYRALAISTEVTSPIDEVTAVVDSLTFAGHGRIRTSDVEFVTNSTLCSPGISMAPTAPTGNGHFTQPHSPFDLFQFQPRNQQQPHPKWRQFGDFDLMVTAHRSILQSWPEFATLFQNHPRPLDRPMRLKCPPGLDLLALQNVIQFLYLGQIPGPGHHFYYNHHQRHDSFSTLDHVGGGGGGGVLTRIGGGGGGVGTRNVGNGRNGSVDWRKIFQVADRFGVHPLVNDAIERLLQEHEGYPTFPEETTSSHSSHVSHNHGFADPRSQYTYGVKKRCPVQTLFQWAYQYPDLETRLLDLIFQYHVVDLFGPQATAVNMVVDASRGRSFAYGNGKVEQHWKRKRTDAEWEQHQQSRRREQRAKLAALHEKLGRFQSHSEFSRIHNTILARILEHQQRYSNLDVSTMNTGGEPISRGSSFSNLIPQATSTMGLPTRKLSVSTPNFDHTYASIPRKRKLPSEFMSTVPDKHVR